MRIAASAVAAKLRAALILGIAVLNAGAFASHPSSPGGVEARLVITGSSTMAPLITELARRFQSLHPGAKIEVQSGGSGRGISDARSGKADIGMVSRALSGSEAQDLYGFAIARDGVAVVVHKDNPVRVLSDRQVTDIYSGRITNWKITKGRDVPIVVLAAEPDRSSTELFTHYFGLAYGAIKAKQVLGDNPARIRAIIENPTGIVYVSVGEAERIAQAGAPIKLLPVDGVTATSRTIRSGDYPISRPLALVTNRIPKGLVKEFINFCLSSHATAVVVKHDCVPYLD